jgi:hypothetical protein
VKERRGHCTKTPDKENKMLPFFGNADAAIKKRKKSSSSFFKKVLSKEKKKSRTISRKCCKKKSIIEFQFQFQKNIFV